MLPTWLDLSAVPFWILATVVVLLFGGALWAGIDHLRGYGMWTLYDPPGPTLPPPPATARPFSLPASKGFHRPPVVDLEQRRQQLLAAARSGDSRKDSVH